MNGDSKLRMTREQAEFVKHARLECHLTLRELAGECYINWDHPNWISPGNQIDGVELVAVAMYLLDEDWGEYTLNYIRDMYPSERPLPKKTRVL